jgi:signal transduction histidine kinase
MSEREPLPRASEFAAQSAPGGPALALPRSVAALCVCRDGRIESTSAAFALLFDQPGGDLVGRPAADLFVPEQRSQVAAALGGDAPPVELPLVLAHRTDDLLVPLALRVAPMDEPGRRIVYAHPLLPPGGGAEPTGSAVAAALDRLMLDVLPDALYVVQDGILRYANRAALELVGRGAGGDLVGRPLTAIAMPEEAPELLRRLADVARRGRPAAPRVVRLRRRADEPVEVEVLMVPFVLDGQPAVQLVARDLRAFRHAAAELRVTEARFRRILEASRSVYWILRFSDPALLDDVEAGDFERPYASVAAFAGEAERLPAGPLRRLLSAPEWERFRGALLEAFERRRSTGWVDLSVGVPGGVAGGRGARAVWRSEIFPLVERGAVTGVQGISQEVTSLRALEERLRESHKLEALGRLSGAIAHDFNNILETIVGFAALLREHPDERVAVRDGADTILRAATRAADLTRQLQAFGHTGRVEYRAVALNGIVEDVVSLLPPAVVARIRIELDLDPALPAVWGDPGQLQQVVLNLVVNASDAMPEGGAVRLRTRGLRAVRPLPVVDGALPPTNYVLLRVSDTGPGIPPDVVPHVFEPFYSTKAKGGDSRHQGLGLSVVYGVVRQHAGGVRVRSRPGRGATFDVVIPVSDRPVDERRARVAAPAPRARGERILVVDDERDILLLNRTVLTRAGYDVAVAASGAEAIQRFESDAGRVAAVVLDLVLPDRSGGEVFTALRAIAPDVPVLVASGHDREGVAPEIFQHARTAFLQKPYQPADLLEALRAVLETPL